MMRMLSVVTTVFLLAAPVAVLAADNSHPVDNTESAVTPGNQNNVNGTSDLNGRDSSMNGPTTTSKMNRADNGSSSKTVSDSWITTKTKAALLADKNASAKNVHVTTKNGIVSLNGKVKSEDAKQAAENDARNIDGVKDVVNNLVVARNQTASK